MYSKLPGRKAHLFLVLYKVYLFIQGPNLKSLNVAELPTAGSNMIEPPIQN